jgi:hypothetical protein
MRTLQSQFTRHFALALRDAAGDALARAFFLTVSLEDAPLRARLKATWDAQRPALHERRRQMADMKAGLPQPQRHTVPFIRERKAR